jgi:putative aminopeptidase FrvX
MKMSLPIMPIMPIVLVAALILPAFGVAAQQDDTIRLLEALSNAPGPPGLEEPIRKLMLEQMKPYADKISYDGLGSVIAVQGSTGPRIMVDAHMDELGGMIRRITPAGYLSMQMLGGWLDQALVDQRWVIIGTRGPVEGITGIRDIHIVPPEERTRVFPRDSLLLDVGANSAEEVRAMGIDAGAPVVPDSKFQVLNGTANYLGKAWDDRVGCAIIVEAMRRLAHAQHPNQIYYAATVQEEVGGRGAHTASDLIKPDIGIGLEGGVTVDTPGTHPEESQVKLGSGPALFLYDSSELPNRKLVAFVNQSARAASIPLQFDLVQGYGDDAAEIQKSNGGVPAINLVVPVRYTHAHNGIINRGDFDHGVDLVVTLLKKLDSDTVAGIRDFAR